MNYPHHTTEAERFLAERQQQALQRTTPPPIAPGVSEKLPESDKAAPTGRGVKWLNFVNYVLLPLDAITALISIGGLIAMWGDLSELEISPAVTVVGLALGFCFDVALFFGLRLRKPWGWWLMMTFLVVKAPLGALRRYSFSEQTDLFLMFVVIGFLAVCLPQLIYFNRRRDMFGVK